MSPARLRALRRIAPVLGLVGLVVLFLWKLVFTNLILARGDLFLYFYPYWDYRARALLAGRLPLWEPLLFMGAPFLANSQAGVLYPLNWPLALFIAPVAVKAAIVMHIAIAALGTFAFARRALGQSIIAALTAAAAFALGGYLTAQVEHVNQLQGLAWLPWMLLAAHSLVTALAPNPAAPASFVVAMRSRRVLGAVIALAVLMALQLLAGHTQSALISLAGAGLYAATAALLLTSAAHRTRAGPAERWTRRLAALLVSVLLGLLGSAALAALLAAAQVLPTLELSAQSLRGGGLSLRDALSFSLDPRVLGRALLPSYSRTFFSEFVAYPGVTVLALAVLGFRRSTFGLALVVMAAVGLAFALGIFNPVYGMLALLPPFSLFRVPARWLVLVALGVALLAGFGLDELSRPQRRPRRWLALLSPLALMALSPLAANLTPAGETGPLGFPAAIDWVGWLLPLLLLIGLILAPLPAISRAERILLLAVLELFASGQVLPYNQPTAPQAYTSIRPAMTQLLAVLPSPLANPATAQWPFLPGNPLVVPGAPTEGLPARFLSLSALRFDPGDLAELQAALGPQLPPGAVYDLIIASKHKEVLSPNLPLAWGVPAVDGYDGGVLPLRHYAEFTQLFTGSPSTDGRLRENLPTVPDPRLLALVNARYLITDKVGDAWIDGVFYDLQFTLTVAAGESYTLEHLPAFEATALGLVVEGGTGEASVRFVDGSSANAPAAAGHLTFARPGQPSSLTLTGPLVLRGLSLIDGRSGAFQSLTLGPYRLVHSGDVKVYEHLGVLPRAWVAPRAQVVTTAEAARALLADPAFDAAQVVILAAGESDSSEPGAQAGADRPVNLVSYAAEKVVLEAEGPGYLVLTDAYYPGWKAYVDGMEVPIHRANIMFRAVQLPSGSHTIEFRYEPASVQWGLALSGLAWGGLAMLALRRRQTNRWLRR